MNDDEYQPENVFAGMERLHRVALRWLGVVILVAVIGVILLALSDELLPSVFGRSDGTTQALSRGEQTDQAVAILGNIASAGIGGLVGWMAKDLWVRTRDTELASAHNASPPPSQD
jgi:hypothetical protein